MIPAEIAAIATLIFDGWSELDVDDKGNREALRSIFAAARRVHDAGYRKPEGLPKCPICDGIGTHQWNCTLNKC